MKNTIKKNKISFKIGSLQWLNFFGMPIGLIGFSFIQIFLIIKDSNTPNNTQILCPIIILILGVSTYYFQTKRLLFKTLKINKDILIFKNEIREILNNNEWKIDYDNKLYLQARYEGSLFNSDMLTLKFKKSEIQWNIIHHPNSQNSIASLFTLNKQGNRIIKKITAIAAQ
jgi:hypothetical protein